MNDQVQVKELLLEDILPNRFQPRVKFSEAEVLALAESIKNHGVIHPILVRPIGDKYEIIAGERRYKASEMAGKKTIPAIIKQLDDKQSAELALIENVQRKDLTPIEEAQSYRKVLDMGYLTQEQLAQKLGKKQSTIANKLRLLNLDEDVQNALLYEKISERHARSLLKLSRADQKKMLKEIIDNKDKKQSGTAFPDIPPTVEYISLNIPTAINGDMALSVGNIDFSDMTCGLTISGISGESSESIPFTGFNAPLFKKKSVEGRSISLEKMRGHYILIDFWGTWCKPCISVIPELRDIHKKYPQLELINVAVDPAPNTNYGFTPAPLKTAIKELQMDWINIQDRSAEGSEQISEKYKIKSYPTTVLIDTDSKIIYRKSSILAMDSLRQILEDVFGY